MKKIIALIFLLSVSCAFGQNVLVTNPPSKPIPITGTITASMGGAAHEANSQVATSTTAGTLIIARPTRVGCLIKNLDATITIYIGAATVTSANGMPLKAGESVVVTAQTLYQVIAASGTPTVAVLEEFN